MSALFVRNENGRGYRPTPRGMALLRIWDAVSVAAFVGFVFVLLQPGDTPWWMYVLIAPFAVAPLLLMMLATGRGPVRALLHYVRIDRAKDRK